MYVCISNRLFVCKVFFCPSYNVPFFSEEKVIQTDIDGNFHKRNYVQNRFCFLLNKRPIQLPLPFICSPYRYMPTVFDRKKYMSTNFRIVLFALRRRLLVTKIEATFVCFLVFSALKVVCTASLTSFN